MQMIRKENLKKAVAFISVIAIVCVFFSMIIYNGSADNTSEVFAADEGKTIVLRIDSPIMTVNGEEKNIDENGTSPVIISGRTLVPIPFFKFKRRLEYNFFTSLY